MEGKIQKIREFIYENKWEQVAYAVLAATVNEHFGDDEIVFEFIIKGLKYMMLGNYYAKCNINQGILAAQRDNDIMLLNAATVMMPNTMFTLRSALYDSDIIGVVGCVTNHHLNEKECAQMSEYISYSEKN